MHYYKPSRENKANIVIPVILILCALIAIVFSQIKASYFPALLQLIAVCCAAAAVQIISRYSLSSFVYEINEEEKTLEIIRLQSKKRTAVCSVALASVKEIVKKQKDFSVKDKYGKDIRALNFCVNMFPQNAYYLIVSSDSGKFALQIEANQEFLSLISREEI